MPAIQALPTWAAWNNANFTSSSGLTDSSTGQPFAAGGLNPGDYFDANNEEAAGASFTQNGLLYGGRYRYIQVDSGATAANVKTGTIGYLRAGNAVKTAITLTPGSGQAPGVYNIAANFGQGGSGAILQVVVGPAGTVTGNPVVIAGGFNYVAAPTFTFTAAGGTGATFVVQLGSASNVVTSADQAPASVRPVVFLNPITPGNFGFVQELGTATVLSGAFTQTAGQFANTAAIGGNGTMIQSGTVVTTTTIGQVIDAFTAAPPAGTPFKILMGITATVVQD